MSEQQERYARARAAVVEAVKEFIVAGNTLGRTDLEIQMDFMAAFTQAATDQEAA